MNTVALLSKKFGIYLASVLAAYILAVVGASWHVANRLASMGVPLDAGERLAMTARDLAGMAGMFVPIIAFGFLVAFLVTALLCRWPRALRPKACLALYALAGFAALVCVHVTLHLAFGLTPVAVARTLPGLLGQGLAGAVGGLVYRYLNEVAFTRSPFGLDE